MTRFVTLIFAFLFFLSGFGQSDRLVYKGEQARALIRGASEIVFDTRGQRPEYISFGKGWLMEQQDFPALLPGVMGLGKDYSLTLQGTALQDKDAIHQRLRMAYQGTPVEDGMWVAHLRQGELYALNGNLYRSILPLNQVVLTAKAARTLALQTVGALSYRWEDEGEEAHLRRETGNPSASYFPQGELILSPYLSDEVQGHRYAWKFRIYASKPLALREVLIDASNGEVIRNLDLLSAIDAPGLAVTKYSGNQEIMADSTATGYRLRETGRGNGIETYNMLTGTNYASAVDFTDSDNYWNNFNTAKDEVATDAHWGAEMTYDYFLDVHGRNSIDDNGFTLRSYVHYDVAYANAFWDGYRMTYGDGNGSINPLVALDIVAHEISHGVTTYTADLVYAYEPGAMNEAFSDIFGTAVEFFAKPAAANWTIGENLGGAFRSMSNPNAYGDPDTYLGNNWYSGSNDNGGVHTNSGVLNHWFYLLSVGGNGINDLGNAYSVTGLGILDASRVAYRMLSVYLTNTSQYADARFYGIKSAIDLFGPCTPAVASVTNAFHAVGIGAPYYNGVLADFDASATAFCTVPAQVKFSNNTVNGITYLWDFGDGNSSASAEPVHYYSQAGAFNVQLIADGGVCGSDTLVKAALVHVNPPAPPQVQHAQSCGPDSLVLIAVGTDSIHWYAPGNQFLAKGDTFSTPLLNQSATYYAYNVLESPPVFGAKPNNSGGGGYFSASNSHHLEFNATDAVILRSVKVYASTSGYRTISLEDASGTTLAAMSINIPSGESRVQLDFNVPPGNGHKLVGPGSPDLFRNNSGCNYPYTAGPAVTITGSSATTNPTGYYYYFYDWEVEQQPCVSLPVAVQAFINTSVPQASFSYAQSGDTVIFQSTSMEANTHYWDLGDGTTSSLPTVRHLYDTSGIFLVRLAVSNACGDDSVSQQVPVIVTARPQPEALQVQLFPNPTQGMVWVQGFPVHSSEGWARITDLQGRIIVQQALAKGDIHTLDLSGLNKGVFFLTLGERGSLKTLRLIRN